MPIIVRLDVMLALRKVRSKDLAADDRHHRGQSVAAEIGQGQRHPLRDARGDLRRLDCKPGDILDYEPDSAGRIRIDRRAAPL